MIEDNNIDLEAEIISNEIELNANLDYRGPVGPEGPVGPQGYNISYIKKISGTGESGTKDIYEIHLNDENETVCGIFSVYNGKDGMGAGDMKKNVYDSNDNGIVDNAEKVNNHTVEDDVPENLNKFLNDLRDDIDNLKIPTKTSDLENDCSYITDMNLEERLVSSNNDLKEELNKKLIPDGGTTGQVLAKKSDTNNDVGWVDQTGGIPDYDSAPVGATFSYPSNNLPIGYLLCDGSLISRTEYSQLFNVIGTSFNLETDTDDTKFRLPDYRDRVPVGLDSKDTNFNTLGKTGGEKEHKLTIDELPISSFKASGSSGDWTYVGVSSTKPHNNLPPYIVTNYIIKASGTAVLKGNVVNNLTDNSTENAPSQRAVNEALLDKYSTEEQRIGTWFGKPLYRKSFYFDTVSSSNVDIGILPTNIKDISGRFLNDGYFNKINQYTTDQNYRFNIDVSPTGIMRIQKGTSVTATDVYIDIEYAKKTD